MIHEARLRDDDVSHDVYSLSLSGCCAAARRHPEKERQEKREDRSDVRGPNKKMSSLEKQYVRCLLSRSPPGTCLSDGGSPLLRG